MILTTSLAKAAASWSLCTSDAAFLIGGLADSAADDGPGGRDERQSHRSDPAIFRGSTDENGFRNGDADAAGESSARAGGGV